MRGESGAELELAPVIEQACEGLATALERAQAYLRTAGETGADQPHHAVRRQRADPGRA